MARITIRSINKNLGNTKDSIYKKINTAKGTIISVLNKKKILIKVIFMILFIIGTLLPFSLLTKLDEYIPPNSYEYDFRTYGFNTLRNFGIYQDFTKKIGNISFTIEKEDYNIEAVVIIQFPIIINNQTIGKKIKSKN